MYDINSSDYLGEGFDNAHRRFDAFLINGELHIVYDINTTDQYVSTANLEYVKNNMDEFLWTPFIDFV